MSSDGIAMVKTTAISRRKTLWVMLAVLLMVGTSFAAANLGYGFPSAAPSGGHPADLKPLLALSISGTATPSKITKGSSSTIAVRATGGTSPYTYAWTGLPAPCTATSTTTSVSCTPASAGTAYITVWVTDSTGTYTSVTITLQIIWKLLSISAFTSSSNPVLVNSATTISTSVSGGQSPYTYAYSGVPTGCTATVTSSFSCTPTATGAFVLKVTVTDSGLPTANVTSAQLVLTVNTNVWATLSITAFTSSSNPAYVNQGTTISATVTGGQSPYTYVYSGVPTGCTATATSSFSCTPSAVGLYTMDLVVSDSGGNITSNQLVLKVLSMAITSFTVAPNPAYVSGPVAPDDFTFTSVVQGAIGTVTYSWTGLPPGCPSANAASITCTTTVSGTYTVEVFATDSAIPTPDTANQTVSETVLTHALNSFTVSPNPVTEGSSVTFASSAVGFFGLPTYTYTGLPAGCTSVNASTFSCTPTTFGTFPVTLTIKDWTGNTNTGEVFLVVSAVAQPNLYVTLNSTLSDQPHASQLCANVNSNPFYTSTCYSQSTDPQILTLGNSVTAIGYQVLTSTTNNTCPAASQYTNSRVVFAVSNSGVNTANPLVGLENTSMFPSNLKVYLGDTTRCTALNAIEPSFARNATTGVIFGVYVAENSSSLPVNYASRAGDMLEFVTGHVPFVGGVVGTPVFSTPLLIPGVALGNLALPQVSMFGNTIYVVYENIANSSTPIPGGYLPISVNFISGTYNPANGAVAWGTPAILPSLGKASQGFNAMNPSISTSVSGRVAVTYATNRACDSYLNVKLATCLHYGSSIVVYSSVTNGTSWVGPSIAATNVTESMCYSGTCLSSFYQATPETSLRFSPNGTRLFVAWAGALNLSSGILPTHSSLWYRWTGVGAAQSANFALGAASTWSGGLVPFAHVDTAPLGGNTTNYYRPSLGVSPNAQVYLAFSMDNETPSSVAYPGPWNNSLSEWVTMAPVLSSGPQLNWGRAAPVQVLSLSAGINTNSTRNSFSGYRSSIAFTSTGVPLLAFSIAQFPGSKTTSRSGYYSINTTYGTNLSLAELASYGLVAANGAALVTNVTFTGAGLPTNPTWSFLLDNQVVTSVSSASLLLSNVPLNAPVYPGILPYGGGGAGYSATTSTTAGPVTHFTGPSTVTDTYTVWVAFNMGFEPWVNPSVTACPSSASYCEVYAYTEAYVWYCNPAFPILPNVSTYESFTSVGPCFYSNYESASTCSAEAQYGWNCQPNYCNVDYQVGCEEIELEFEDYLEYDAGTTYNETYSYEYVDAYCSGQPGCNNEVPGGGDWYFENEYESYTYSGGQHGGLYRYGTMPNPMPASATINQPPQDVWANLGLQLNPFGYYYDTGYPITASEYITYANSSSPGGYNGPVTECLGGTPTNCHGLDYAEEYEYAYYGGNCTEAGVEECTFVPDVFQNPIYQTLWFLAGTSGSGGQTAPQEITPQGLPTGSTYSFNYGTTTYVAVSPNGVLIKAAPQGTNYITDARAAGSNGFTYYATNLSVQVPSEAFVNLTFSTYVHTSAPTEKLTFYSPQIPTGTPWGIRFNGSVFDSSTPYINITAHPGKYAVTGWNVTTVTGDANYTPEYVFGQVANLLSATTQILNYSATYRVAVTTSFGGLVQIGSGAAANEAFAWVASGTVVTINAMPSAGNAFAGWTGTGTGSYSGPIASDHITVGGPISETASFYRAAAARDTLTFVETTLPAGTWWSIVLSGVGYSSDTSSITVANVYPCNGGCGNPNALGHYNLTVEISYSNETTSGTRYIPTATPTDPLPTWVSSNGTTSAIAIAFAPQFLVNVIATPGGSVSVLNGQAVVTVEPFWANNNSVVTIQAAPNAPNSTGHWAFESWVGSGSGSYSGGAADESGTVTVNGPITEVANFIFDVSPPAPTYTLTVTLGTPLAPGTSWTVNVGSNTYSSTNSTLTATMLSKGTYSFGAKDAYAPSGTTRYVPSNVVSIITITANKTVALDFTVQYWVDIQNTTGGAVLLSSPSGAPQASEGWFASGTQLVLGATAGSSSTVFTNWVGTGVGSYTGPLASGTITVSGPISEVAGFVPVKPSNTSVSEPFNAPIVWIALAIVGIVVGLAIGLLLFRRRDNTPPPSGSGGASSGSSGSKTAPEYSEEQGGEP